MLIFRIPGEPEPNAISVFAPVRAFRFVTASVPPPPPSRYEPAAGVSAPLIVQVPFAAPRLRAPSPAALKSRAPVWFATSATVPEEPVAMRPRKAAVMTSPVVDTLPPRLTSTALDVTREPMPLIVANCTRPPLTW